MMRNDINFAIVEMVRSNDMQERATFNGANGTISNRTVSESIQHGEFDWSSGTQSIILGSFYWCYVLSQVN